MKNHLLEKEYIEKIKSSPENLSKFLGNEINNGKRLYLLKKIGRLEKSYYKDPLVCLLFDKSDQIRFWAVKNLAKLRDISLLDSFYNIAKNDKSSMVRREAVSSIGRLRNEISIPYLSKLLLDPDPKVSMQAIRGLLVFKKRKDVFQELFKLTDHPNEMIREIISNEIGNKEKLPEKNHSKSNSLLTNCVVLGDVLEIISKVPDNSVHLTFTSPPYYNARDYSTYVSYKDYLEFLEEVFKEVHRITKEGRFFILNTSPIIVPRISRNHSSKRYPIPYDIHPYLINMGWEFVDDIIWVKPEASVKNRNAGFLQHRKPLAYKPNPITEMLMVYRKKTPRLIDWNIRQYEESIIKSSKVDDDYETTNIWQIDPSFDKVHSAVFPIELCSRVIKYYSMVGDLVFDPFAGSGTLGKAAIQLNRKFFLTEINKNYFEQIKREIRYCKIANSKQKINARFLERIEFSKRLENDNFRKSCKEYNT